MTTRSMGPLAGFSWLTRGISVGLRHPKPLFGGAGLLLVACLLPTLVTMPLQFRAAITGTPMNPATFGWIMALSMLLGLLLIPLYAGYLQVIDAADRGLPARALDIFNPYREGDALRLIGYGLAVIALYVLIFAIVIAVTGGGLVDWYMQAMTAQTSHLPPPALPSGFGIAVALIAVLCLFMMGFYAISLGQVALNRRNLFGALGDGTRGALKNVLPLIMFTVGAVLGWIALAIVVMIAVLLLVLIGKFVGAWLTFVVIVPIYIALLLTMFMWMFGSMYYLWRDVCGHDAVPDVAPMIAA